MKPLDLRTLLGGYAAGTLTPEERELLFQAALNDQALFNALADEEALRELLAEPGARAQLLSDLRETPAGFSDRAGRWLWRPATLAFAGSALALVLIVGVVRYARQQPAAPKLVAQAPAAVVSENTRAEPKPNPAVPPRRQAIVMLQPRPEKAAAELRDQAAAPASLAPQPAALTYAIQVRDPGEGWRDAPPGAALHGGDRIRLRVRPAEDGYILLTAGEGPASKALTPAGGAQAKAGQDLFVPASDAVELEGVSGEKTLRLSFSSVPLPAPTVAYRFARSAEVSTEAQKAESDKPPAPEPRVIDIRLRYGPQ